ncbi:HlyC/CorC family transporter [Paenalkalicoccus suaedae]|uniref:HlyC/CorC family transporter n=1 Tax=Paenalkalicoccus suaedae TaxID=2592382 RepID=A0A859FCD3_9BACI|nr:hemolysin family protein [Paenalkalicoccus suaedae]QKS70431.1 HlyC/CorC family transporter [Paenalkalicoccus suaedae]
MDSIPYGSILLLGAFLFLSAYFSASETAITSANKVRLRTLAEENNPRAKRSLALTENFDRSLSTILIGNNVVNIGLTAMGTAIATSIFGGTATTLLLTTVVITVVVLTFGEILPKSFAKQRPEKLLLGVSWSLQTVLVVLTPVTWLFVQLKKGLNRLIKSEMEPSVTDEDVKALVTIGEEEGTFEIQERELLHNAIEFDDTIVRDILTPRPDITAVGVDADIEEVKDIFIREKFSRIPIYEESVDNIVGVLSYRDFMTKYVENEPFALKDTMRAPYFVIGTVKISGLLKDLQNNKVHLAIVLDEYGGTAGIISIEDILEEIVGDIWDEHDDKELLIEALDASRFRMDGSISLEDFCESVDISLPATDSYTLGGWISELFGYLPKKGESVVYEHIRIHVEEVRRRRVKSVIIEVDTPVYVGI